MKNNFSKELLIAVLLIVLALLLLNPLSFWMPDMVLMGIVAFLVIVFGFFASFVMKETFTDEREERNRAYAGRAAFLVGSAVIISGILFQSFSHSIDPWLVSALVGMVLAKIWARVYSDKNL